MIDHKPVEAEAFIQEAQKIRPHYGNAKLAETDTNFL